MAVPPVLQNLRLPLIGSPLFIISGPELVIAQCKAGIVGSFPALNAREKDGQPALLDAWLTRISEDLARHNQANPDRPSRVGLPDASPEEPEPAFQPGQLFGVLIREAKGRQDRFGLRIGSDNEHGVDLSRHCDLSAQGPKG